MAEDNPDNTGTYQFFGDWTVYDEMGRIPRMLQEYSRGSNNNNNHRQQEPQVIHEENSPERDEFDNDDSSNNDITYQNQQHL